MARAICRPISRVLLLSLLLAPARGLRTVAGDEAPGGAEGAERGNVQSWFHLVESVYI